MSDNTDAPTEWLANSARGYGWGRTEQDALFNLLANVDSFPDDEDEVRVQLVEHRGDASVSPGGYRVHEFVSGETLTFDAERFADARDTAITAFVSTERLLDTPESVETIEH